MFSVRFRGRTICDDVALDFVRPTVDRDQEVGSSDPRRSRNASSDNTAHRAPCSPFAHVGQRSPAAIMVSWSMSADPEFLILSSERPRGRGALFGLASTRSKV